jgi:hypothetical protein
MWLVWNKGISLTNWNFQLRQTKPLWTNSEEARKAKYQGTVLLWIIVDPQGQPHDIRVVRSVGKGFVRCDSACPSYSKHFPCILF